MRRMPRLSPRGKQVLDPRTAYQVVHDQSMLDGFRADFTAALEEFGFPPCPGNVMVRNPFWSKPADDYLADFTADGGVSFSHRSSPRAGRKSPDRDRDGSLRRTDESRPDGVAHEGRVWRQGGYC